MPYKCTDFWQQFHRRGDRRRSGPSRPQRCIDGTTSRTDSGACRDPKSRRTRANSSLSRAGDIGSREYCEQAVRTRMESFDILYALINAAGAWKEMPHTLSLFGERGLKSGSRSGPHLGPRALQECPMCDVLLQQPPEYPPQGIIVLS